MLNPTNDAPAPAREDTVRFPSEQRTREHLDVVERDRAPLAAREPLDAATSRNTPIVIADPDRAAATEAEQESRVRRGLQVEDRIRSEMRAGIADRNGAERLIAEREKVERASKIEQRAQAQRDAIKRNRAEMAELEQARVGYSSDMPVLTTDANSAAAILAKRENMELISEAEQRTQAQRDAIERNKIALAARAQARSTSRKPPAVMAEADNPVAASAEQDNST